jgi:hypothetical protein
MHRTVLTLFSYVLFLLPVAAETKVSLWSEQINREWWTQHETPESWTTERASIHRQLVEIHQRLGTSEALANPSFTGWMHHLKWLNLFHAEDTGGFFNDPQARASFAALALHLALRDPFLTALSPYDDQPKSLQNLCRIYRAHPENAVAFPSLAIAISIVFDQPFPASWPHHFVDQKSVPRTEEPPEDRFAFFTKSQEAGLLMYDLKKLSVSELKFVVDTPLSLREMQYVQGVKMRNIKQFHALFSMIKYNLPRLEAKNYVWPHGPYLLSSIAQNGGLCVDQAYYTSHAAKAKGVPNIIFLGQGNSGEHAWMGYLESLGRWRFDLAKSRNEDYPVGQAFDPQTWRRLTDSECEFLNRRPEASAILTRARALLTWADLNPDAPFHLEAIQLARRTAPEFLAAWELEAAHLAETKADVVALTRFWNDWIAAFKDQKDLRFRGEKRLLGLLDEAGQTADYNRLLAQIIASNKNERSDLVVSVAAERVFVHIENKRWEEAHQTFRGAIQKLASKAGGHLFYQLVQPYAQSCLEEGKISYAEEVMKRAADAFEAQEGSILDKDIKELADLVKAKAGS